MLAFSSIQVDVNLAFLTFLNRRERCLGNNGITISSKHFYCEVLIGGVRVRNGFRLIVAFVNGAVIDGVGIKREVAHLHGVFIYLFGSLRNHFALDVKLNCRLLSVGSNCDSFLKFTRSSVWVVGY